MSTLWDNIDEEGVMICNDEGAYEESNQDEVKHAPMTMIFHNSIIIIEQYFQYLRVVYNSIRRGSSSITTYSSWNVKIKILKFNETQQFASLLQHFHTDNT